MGDGFNPYPMLRLAATGDVDAFRTLSVAACNIGRENADLVAFVEAMVFSRLAYAATRDPSDARASIAILAYASEACPDERDMLFSWSAETVALAAQLADSGDPLAEQNLAQIVTESGPAVTEVAKEMLKEMQGVD